MPRVLGSELSVHRKAWAMVNAKFEDGQVPEARCRGISTVARRPPTEKTSSDSHVSATKSKAVASMATGNCRLCDGLGS